MNSPLQIEETPGDHISMMIEPNVAYLAKAINAILAGGNSRDEFLFEMNSKSSTKKKSI